MISQLAKEDLQDLRDEGLHPTDEDVIRLHALGCRLSDGAETTAACAPRNALCGGFVFWEPTIAAWEWYTYAKEYAADDAVREYMFAYACVHGRERGVLDRLRDPAEIEKAIGGFIASLAATKGELIRAVNWVTVGPDDVIPDKPDGVKELTDDERTAKNYARVEDKIRKAAASTGLTFDEIMIQTPSRLDGMIYEANVLAGMTMTTSVAKLHADYLATLCAIRKRLTAERDAAAGKADPTPAPPSDSPAAS